MSSDAPETAANLWYIVKQAASPSLISIVFDDDNSNLSRADNINVDDEAGVIRLTVTWANGKSNEFALPDRRLTPLTSHPQTPRSKERGVLLYAKRSHHESNYIISYCLTRTG
jgi:hypothetical protein